MAPLPEYQPCVVVQSRPIELRIGWRTQLAHVPQFRSSTHQSTIISGVISNRASNSAPAGKSNVSL
jgi:hypothetical protein